MHFKILHYLELYDKHLCIQQIRINDRFLRLNEKILPEFYDFVVKFMWKFNLHPFTNYLD